MSPAVWYLIEKFLSKDYLLEVKLKETLEQLKIISLNLCLLMYASIRVSSLFICYLLFANPGNNNLQDTPMSSSRKVKVKKKGRDEISFVRTDSSEPQGCSTRSLS